MRSVFVLSGEMIYAYCRFSLWEEIFQVLMLLYAFLHLCTFQNDPTLLPSSYFYSELLILHRDERLQRGRTTLEDLNLDCCKTGTVTLKFSRQKYSKAVGRNVWEWIREKSAIEIMANSCCWHQRWVLLSNAYVFSIFRMAHFQFEISDDEEEVCTKWSSPVVNNCRKSSNFVLDEVIFQACFTF